MKNKFGFLMLFSILLTGLPATTMSDFTLRTMNNDAFSLNAVLGKKVVVIDFWATWCKPCTKLLKRLNGIQKQYPGEVAVIAISVDEASAFSAVESVVKGRRFEFTVLLDPESTVSRIYNPTSKIPFTMVLDLQGKIVYTHTGYIPGAEKEIEKVIEAIIGQKRLE